MFLLHSPLSLATWHSGMQRISPSILILKLKTENRQEAGHNIFCALVNNGLYHGIIEIKEGLADVTTLETWKWRAGAFEIAS